MLPLMLRSPSVREGVSKAEAKRWSNAGLVFETPRKRAAPHHKGQLFRMPGRGAERHAALPVLLAQALQAGGRDLSLSTAAGGTGAVFKLAYWNRGAAMKQFGEHPGAPVDFEIANRVGDAVGMTERDHLAAIGVTNFVNAGTNRRLNELAVVGVRKSLPTCPALHHPPSGKGGRSPATKRASTEKVP